MSPVIEACMQIGARVFVRLHGKPHDSVIRARVISFDDETVCVCVKHRRLPPTKSPVRFYPRAQVFLSKEEAMAGEGHVLDGTNI